MISAPFVPLTCIRKKQAPAEQIASTIQNPDAELMRFAQPVLMPAVEIAAFGFAAQPFHYQRVFSVTHCLYC